jgi:ABC-2 type transport system ATP-binding protein
MTSREILEFTASLFYRGPRRAIQDRVQEVLELVGLEDKADRMIRGFSGGERQRLGIAQAQVNYPDLLILDEPAASLDPMGRHDVLGIMERLRQHTTIFFSTHILDDVQRVSDRVVILNHGQLIAQGPIEELLVGTGGPVYKLVVEGDQEKIHKTMKNLPWVTDLTANQVNGSTRWNVAVSDEGAAKAELLRTVLAIDHINVLEYGRQTFELEEIFMNLVQEK